MKNVAITALCALVVVLAAGVASASTILTPTGIVADGGSCYGSWAPLFNAFDKQPVWDGTKPVGGGLWGDAKDAPYGDDKWGYIDLGPDWAKWRIEQGWTYYRKWSGPDFNNTGNQVGTDAAMWVVSSPSVWPAPNTRPDSYSVPAIKFNSAQGLADSPNEMWAKDFDVTGAPIIPQGRYLIIHTPVGTTNRAMEYAIVGTIVPEPATLTLLAIGGLAMLRRRK